MAARGATHTHTHARTHTHIHTHTHIAPQRHARRAPPCDVQPRPATAFRRTRDTSADGHLRHQDCKRPRREDAPHRLRVASDGDAAAVAARAAARSALMRRRAVVARRTRGAAPSRTIRKEKSPSDSKCHATSPATASTKYTITLRCTAGAGGGCGCARRQCARRREPQRDASVALQTAGELCVKQRPAPSRGVFSSSDAATGRAPAYTHCAAPARAGRAPRAEIGRRHGPLRT